MKKALILGVFVMLVSACQKNDPTPVYVNPILGTWQIENSDVVITFDIIKIKSPVKGDSLFTTNNRVTYLGKTAYAVTVGDQQKVAYENGTYSFSFQNNIGTCPVCSGNFTQLSKFVPNATFTEMTSHANMVNPYDGSWVSVTSFDGTLDNKVIILSDPIILKKIKGL